MAKSKRHQPPRPPKPAPTHPEHHPGFFRKEWPALLIALVLTLVMQFLEYHGWLAGPEGKIFDWLLRSAGSVDTQSANPIFTVEIDDAAYATCFNSASPLDAGGIVRLVKHTADSGAAVIGVDIITDSDAYREQASALAPEMPRLVWIAGGEQSVFRPASFPAWLIGRHDELTVRPTQVLGSEAGESEPGAKIRWGLPVFPRDDDQGLRRVPRRVEISADPAHSAVHEEHPSLARMVAEEYCQGRSTCHLDDGEGEEVFVPYGGRAPGRFHMLDLFRCPAQGLVETGGPLWEEFESLVKDKIVLIGGSFGSARDFYETPLGRLPGLVVNAYAVQAEMDGSGLEEASRPFAAVFDFVVGALIVFLFWRFEHLPHGTRWAARVKGSQIRYMLGASLLLLAAAMALNVVLFGKGYIVGFIGVGFGVLLHQIVEIWVMNPQPRE